MLRKPSREALLAGLVLLALLGAALVGVYPPMRHGIGTPFSYEGDALWNLFVVKTVIETGWYHGNPNLGAPFGAVFLDFAKPEVLHLLLIRIMALFTEDIVLVHNGFYLFGFFAVGLSALWVLRGTFRLDWPLAVAGAFLFAWLPYHFLRVAHLFLSNYFAVPVAVWLTFQVAHAPIGPAGPMRHLLSAPGVWLAAAVVASTSIYYAYFAILLTLAAGGLAALSEKQAHRLAVAVAASAMICAFAAINLAPSVHYKLSRGPNPEVAKRDLHETDRYALSPALMLLPSQEHRLEPLAAPTRRYASEAAFINENQFAWLGTLATIGFIFLLLRLLSGDKLVPDQPLLGTLGRLNAVAVLLAVTGGGGTLIALLVSPQFRAMNRISVFIAFFSLAALLVLIQSALPGLRRLGRHAAAIIAAALILFGLWDQTIQWRAEDPAEVQSRFSSDRAYAGRIESGVQRGARIYQMPYIAFPESSPVYQETVYAHLAGYLHSEHVRWSFGGFKGRPEELWHRALSRLPLAEQIDHIARAGFHGISLNRLAVADHGAALESQLVQLGLVRAHESPAKDKVFYRLEPTGNSPAALPLPIVWGENFYSEEHEGRNRWAWSRGDASLIIHLQGRQPTAAQIRLDLSSLVARQVTLAVAGTTLRQVQLVPGKVEAVVIERILAPGQTILDLTTDQPPLRASAIDKRRVAFAVGNPSVHMRFEKRPAQPDGHNPARGFDDRPIALGRSIPAR